MANLRIVLVEPREAGNVGAAARAMKNFGFRDLRIVGTPPAQMKPYSDWWASGAEDLVAAIDPVPTLLDAIDDAHVTVATTSARGRSAPVDLTPAQVAERFASLDDGQTLAIVFGRENHGLTRDEAVMCHHTAVIPTHRDFPVMNLAQSVSIFCYELSTVVPIAAPARVLPPAGLVERLHQRLEKLLFDIGFFHADNPDRIYDELRALMARTSLDERETKILLGIARQLEWKLGKQRDRGEKQLAGKSQKSE
jgi:TrmH family RNA methyltransferase